MENAGGYTITYRNISAVVSDRENAFINYSDRESLGYLLVHHQRTIEILMNKGFNMLIPMKLGTIVSSREDVIKILANGHDLFIDILKKVEHLTEIDLAVTWADFPAILNEIAGHPEITRLKNELLVKKNTLLQSDQVKLGMMVQEKLKENNTEIRLNILELLSPVILNRKTHEVMNDQMISNSAFLIDERQKGNFEKIIDQIDEQYNGKLNFKLVGSLPCYSFYTIEVKELNPENVVKAKRELELKEETTECEIKKAYLGKAKLFHPDRQTQAGEEENFNRVSDAYHILVDYAAAVKQSAKENINSLVNENCSENLILVKIKE